MAGIVCMDSSYFKLSILTWISSATAVLFFIIIFLNVVCKQPPPSKSLSLELYYNIIYSSISGTLHKNDGGHNDYNSPPWK